MRAGQHYGVSRTAHNNDEMTWSRAQQYSLMSQAPHNNMTWGLGRVAMPVEEVRPGESVTFVFPVTAPATAGTYVSQWGMQREGHGSFGASTAPVTVNVVAPPPLVNHAQAVSMAVPDRMVTGKQYNVAVTMQNIGTPTWTQGANYKLGSQNPHDNLLWGLGRIDVTAPVAPGQQHTFNFSVTAPAAGDYSMQWGMVQEYVTWFGLPANRPVTVTEDLGNVTFIHTDGLGSPVARTDGSGKVISRTRYEPYGYVASGATPTIGFTGHVNDADTGLTYMQQRYYDPVAGRFLSIDPVTTDANTGGSFNRYAYANNSPYKYIDPDGRNPAAIPAGVGGTLVCGLVCGGIAAGTVLIGGTYAGKKIVDWWNSRSEPKRSDSTVPPAPDTLVGEQGDKAGPSKNGKRHTSGPLTPENGGAGDAKQDFDKLTGGSGKAPDWSDSRSSIPGVQVGDNGIWIWPDGKDGP